MGLKTGKSKMSRKVKKAIRRSVSGVLMASAIIVALVPATPTQGYTDPTYTTTEVKYDYGVQATDYTNLATLDSGLANVDLDKYINNPTGTTVYQTKTVTQLSDGKYEIMWQFKVYELTGNLQGKGIICEYNSLYNKGQLEINTSLPLDYVVVEKAFYDAFFDAHAAAKAATNNDATIAKSPTDASTQTVRSNYHLSTVEATPATGSVQDVVQIYWPEDFANYKARYDAWVAQTQAYNAEVQAHDAWVLKNNAYQNWLANGGVEPEHPGIEPQITTQQPSATAPDQDFWVADMLPDFKNRFFCEGQPYYCNTVFGGLNHARTYKLVSVIDSRNGATTPQQFIWMPKGVPGEDDNDSLGFKGQSWTAIIGIGKRAFADTSNVTSLRLAGELKYIGDEAFANSFVESINFANVEDIGNRAYKNCTKLQNISLSDTTVNIGTEAFYGCNSLVSLSLPQSISYIGPGAFADCTALTTLDLSAINQSNCDIDNFAFYDDIALLNVTFSDKINRIGDGAFACNKGVGNGFTDFVFPQHITGDHKCKLHTASVNGIGKFVLAGRTNLQTVTMPADYGRTAPVTLPIGTFYNCINLKSVTFPNDGGGSCGFVSLERVPATVTSGQQQRTIFDTIQNPEFCVYGPGFDSAGKIATPRKSTWGLKSGLGTDIPYIYTDSSGQHVEISEGNYIFVIDDNGVIQSCIFSDPQASHTTPIDPMTIPTTIGGKKVTGIASSCFTSTEAQQVLALVKRLVIQDNSISEIAPSAFQGCDLLEEVVIGNSVKSIGASAFADCPKLEKVTIGSGVTSIGDAAFKNDPKLTYVKFDTPAGGYSSLPLSSIGSEAFSTGANKLIFEGGIDQSYGPFVWAMQEDNYVDANNGIRVCYTTGYPTYQTVIVDNRNGYPTLVDYLHYDQIEALGTALGLNPSETTHGLIERYEKQGTEEHDATGNVTYTYSINLAEERLVNAALNLVVPAGVESVDAYGFMNNTSPLGEGYSSVASNSYNVRTYLVTSPYYPTITNPYYSAYKNVLPADIGGGGLFKNYYGTVSGTAGKREYAVGDSMEENDIGNDRLRSVVLNSVKYLPDYCFYDCENLNSINLGSQLTEMGNAPFTGCSSLSSIGSSSDEFICENGIVYSKNDDGSYNIVEVLSARGISVGSSKIKVSDDDPLLEKVSNILPGAFENCDGITSVDLTGMDLLTEIPDNCFKDDDKLNKVVIPANITSIGHNAFAGAMDGIELVCYGKEVFLPSDAFGTTANNNRVKQPRLVSYSDSAVRKSAADLGADVTEVLDDKVKVYFLDYDGQDLNNGFVLVEKGKGVDYDERPNEPTRDGYRFLGWARTGHPINDFKNITEDTTYIAQYEQIPGTDPSGGNGSSSGNNGGGNGSSSGNNGGGNNGGSGSNGSGSGTTAPTFYTLTVTNGNGSGSYAEGATVIITCTNPPSGKVFDKWVATTDDLGIASVNVAATTLKMPAHEASVTATFKDAPSNTSGNGSSNGSGSNKTPSGTTNTGSAVVISKPGISNTSLASATVSGSTDNYIVRIAETAAATAAVEKALMNEYGSLDGIRYSAMDITLYDSTGQKKITDYSGLSVKITMPIPDVMAAYAGNNKVAGVVNEKLDKLNPKFTSIDGVPCVTFTATHFSPYTIYVDTNNVIAGVGDIDVTPKTGDGIQPKWFLVFGLAALSIALFFIKDKKTVELAVE